MSEIQPNVMKCLPQEAQDRINAIFEFLPKVSFKAQVDTKNYAIKYVLLAEVCSKERKDKMYRELTMKVRNYYASQVSEEFGLTAIEIDKLYRIGMINHYNGKDKTFVEFFSLCVKEYKQLLQKKKKNVNFPAKFKKWYDDYISAKPGFWAHNGEDLPIREAVDEEVSLVLDGKESMTEGRTFAKNLYILHFLKRNDGQKVFTETVLPHLKDLIFVFECDIKDMKESLMNILAFIAKKEIDPEYIEKKKKEKREKELMRVVPLVTQLQTPKLDNDELIARLEQLQLQDMAAKRPKLEQDEER